MSTTARHHAEWLSLVDISGPFLSLPVLLDVLPHGLDPVDAVARRRLRQAHREWEATAADPAIHRAFIGHVLEDFLEFPADRLREGQAMPPGLEARVPEHHEILRPDLALCGPEPRLLVRVLPPDQPLDRALPGKLWPASVETRMMTLLHGAGVPLGLATNGEDWLLVHAPRGETTGFARFQATLWFEEPLTLQAFRTLLGVQRFFGVPDDQTLPALLRRSAADQQEVTDQLGQQVRRAVTRLVRAIDRIDRDRQGSLLAGVEPRTLYHAAVTLMMRLVFLLAAEERGLLPADNDLYQQHYAVSSLHEQLQELADRHGEELLERRRDAWSRLLALFRAVHAGLRHDRLTLPAHGGGLFDPDRFPLLEGREPHTTWRDGAGRPLPIDNRTVLHLLRAIQFLELPVPGGRTEARRLSFRALDVEQIGHVYEGLLERTAARATSVVLGLHGSQHLHVELPLPLLEEQHACGVERLVEFLRKRTGRTPSALRNGLDYRIDPAGGLLAACENDDAVYRRVAPFAGLLRADSQGRPVVIGEGSVYVTGGQDRRATGTHYTPRALTEAVVVHALDALVHKGPTEGRPPDEWRLRPAAELLRLKVCDMAMGSGAFLVQACRYLSEKLVEAWKEAARALPGRVRVTPEGELATGRAAERAVPLDQEEEALALARRIVADRCLYGVDCNPMAVEMAKLSLWLVTLQRDRPFTFLDHALRCGDSLFGLIDLDQIRHFHPDPARGAQLHHTLFAFTEEFGASLDRAIAARARIERMATETIRDAEEKARLLAEAEQALAEARHVADLVIAAALSTAGRPDDALDERLQSLAAALASHDDALLQEPARRPFHWALEFPEIFANERPGFDAIVGNPPFQGGKLISGALGKDYRSYLVQHLAGGARGSADLCAYFFLRGRQLVREGGMMGLVATNTIAQGDTREVGLDQLVASGCSITRAVKSLPWPGGASLEVAEVWVCRGAWHGAHVLDGEPVPGMTSALARPGRVQGQPHRLEASQGRAFQGSIVLGMGFVLSPERARTLFDRDPRNADVLFPYLNGKDLNSRPDQSPSRWVINFFDWPLDHESAPEEYDGPVAADYPDCLAIIEEKVKPERTRKKADGSFQLRYPLYLRWWHYADKRPALYAAIAERDQVLAVSLVNNHLPFAVYPAGIVFSHAVGVVPDARLFPVLQSQLHYHWAWEHGSTMRTDLRYTPSDCFETFPFPDLDQPLARIGEQYIDHRAELCRKHDLGLTPLYNRLHDPSESDPGVLAFRELQVALDRAVLAAYGWDDLDPAHDFATLPWGRRFTIAEPARRELLARLLELNHQRYAEEVEQGLHEKKQAKRGNQRKSRRKRGKQTGTLFE